MYSKLCHRRKHILLLLILIVVALMIYLNSLYIISVSYNSNDADIFDIGNIYCYIHYQYGIHHPPKVIGKCITCLGLLISFNYKSFNYK